MKYLPFIITGVISVVVSLAGDCVLRLYLSKETLSHHPTTLASASNRMPSPPTVQSPMNEWQEFHNAREQALRDNPDLATEYQQLRAEIQQQETDLNAAMLKADPKVAPLLAKLELLRHPSPGSNPHPIPSGAVTR